MNHILLIMVFVLIFFLIFYSYYVGARAIFNNKYQPSIYSRAIWFLLTINSFFSVIALKNSKFVILYGALGLIGNLIILILSIRKSPHIFGKTEALSSALLIISLIVWIIATIPLLNLCLGLIAHFIGGIPTIKRAYKKPNSENINFWLYFCLASILTVIIANKSALSDYLFPLYFALFDGLMVLLCLRKNKAI